MTTSFPKWVTVLGAVLGETVITMLSAGVYKGYINLKMIVVLVSVLSLSFFIIFNGSKVWAKKSFLIISVGIVFVAGMFVNSLDRGLDIIYNLEIIKKNSAINESENGLWIVDSIFPLNNIPLMAGAPTINTTNVYPNLERWHLLDPDKSEEEIYNRYAHISVSIVDDETEITFELIYLDQFKVNLNVSDLKLMM